MFLAIKSSSSQQTLNLWGFIDLSYIVDKESEESEISSTSADEDLMETVIEKSFAKPANTAHTGKTDWNKFVWKVTDLT